MERKIGEIFERNGEWYQCVVATQGCRECSFFTQDDCTRYPACLSIERSDNTSVIFKKLEKVGEPYSCNYYGDNRLIMMQEYNLFNLEDVTNENKIPMYITDYKHKRIAIETKQTKEDMEEKNKAKHSNSEKIGKNLKPFDLEAAKAGKPVCTRDGRKARIICFDRNASSYNIVALIECKNFPNKEEEVRVYTNDGKYIRSEKNYYDLMMLPEKKEGWVNVYKRENEYIWENECNVSTGIAVYKSEGEAKRNRDKNEIYINTIKITWEE